MEQTVRQHHFPAKTDIRRLRSAVASLLLAGCFFGSHVGAEEPEPRFPPAAERNELEYLGSVVRFQETSPEELPKALQEFRLRQPRITEVTTDIRVPSKNVPRSYSALYFSRTGPESATGRSWQAADFAWIPSGDCYQPLYFNEPNLERHGYSHGLLQPIYSAAHFYGTIPALPYLVAASPPRECVYTLGKKRPGSPVPYRFPRWPLSVRGGVAESLVVTGLIFTVP